jgi:hypothetical protein
VLVLEAPWNLLGQTPPRSEEAERIRARLEAQTGGRRKKGTTNKPTWNNKRGESTSNYYGLKDPQDNRWVFHDFAKVKVCLDHHGFLLREMFQNKPEATRWKNESTLADDDSVCFASLFGAPTTLAACKDRGRNQPSRASTTRNVSGDDNSDKSSVSKSSL